MEEGSQNSTLHTDGCVIRAELVATPVCPLALEKADNATLLVGTNPIYAAITRPADLHPDTLRILKLEKRDAQMFERARADTVYEATFDLPDFTGPGWR